MDISEFLMKQSILRQQMLKGALIQSLSSQSVFPLRVAVELNEFMESYLLPVFLFSDRLYCGGNCSLIFLPSLPAALLTEEPLPGKCKDQHKIRFKCSAAVNQAQLICVLHGA